MTWPWTGNGACGLHGHQEGTSNPHRRLFPFQTQENPHHTQPWWFWTSESLFNKFNSLVTSFLRGLLLLQVKCNCMAGRCLQEMSSHHIRNYCWRQVLWQLPPGAVLRGGTPAHRSSMLSGPGPGFLDLLLSKECCLTMDSASPRVHYWFVINTNHSPIFSPLFFPLSSFPSKLK